eukprot:3474204-Prymnesium_polylepis.2
MTGAGQSGSREAAFAHLAGRCRCIEDHGGRIDREVDSAHGNVGGDSRSPGLDLQQGLVEFGIRRCGHFELRRRRRG